MKSDFKDKILTNKIKKIFVETFSTEPILIASPGRINLIGEHTDYNNGFVFPASIDKYVIAAFSKSKGKSRIISVDLKDELQFDIKELKRGPRGHWGNYISGVIDELLKKKGRIENFNAVFSSSIPIGAGLSSSAALENCFAFGLNELFHLKLSKADMISVSMNAEHNFVGVQCGIMDQFASMMGVKDEAILLDCLDLSYEYIPVSFKDSSLLLINSNVKHDLASSEYNIRRQECINGVEIIKQKHTKINSLRDVNFEMLDYSKKNMSENIYKRCRFVLEENERVVSAREAIQKTDLSQFGSLLFDSHKGLRNLYEVSCPELDFLVEEAGKDNSISGARMMGGGFGGCTLNLIKNEAIPKFTKKIEGLFFKQFNKRVDIYRVNISNGTGVI